MLIGQRIAGWTEILPIVLLIDIDQILTPLYTEMDRMHDKPPAPGISRSDRLSDEGLKRLERQLQFGSQISDPVLTQWIRRYGEPAREIIRRHDRYHSHLEPAADAGGDS